LRLEASPILRLAVVARFHTALAALSGVLAFAGGVHEAQAARPAGRGAIARGMPSG
jgi:hypothetical protein